MSENKIKFVLIGCGRIAKRHSELLGNNCISNASLSGVCDLNIDSAKKIAGKYSIPAFDDYHKMIKTVDPDVIVVLTESGNHAKNVLDIVKYKKHIMVEKPMALKLSDAEMMISACEKNGVELFVIKQNRFNLPIVKLREAIESGRFGKLLIGSIRVRWCRTQKYYDQAEWRGTWSMDGGVLTNQASHHIDMLIWMMGEVESLNAYSATFLSKIEAEDSAVASLKFKNGAIGTIEATTAARPTDQEGSISILGEKGQVEIGGFAMNEIKIWQFDDLKDEEKRDIQKYSVNPPNVYGYGHQAYYEHVMNSLEKNGTNSINGFSGKKSLEVIHALYKSIETKERIFLKDSPISDFLGNNND